MKRKILSLLFTGSLYLALIFQGTVFSAGAINEYTITASSLNVRSSTSLKSRVVASLKKGTTVKGVETHIYQFIDKKVSQWIEIIINGKKGYLFGAYLKVKGNKKYQHPNRIIIILNNGKKKSLNWKDQLPIARLTFDKKINSYIIDMEYEGSSSLYINYKTGSTVQTSAIAKRHFSPDGKKFFITNADLCEAAFDYTGIQIFSFNNNRFKELSDVAPHKFKIKHKGKIYGDWYPLNVKWKSNNTIAFKAVIKYKRISCADPEKVVIKSVKRELKLAKGKWTLVP